MLGLYKGKLKLGEISYEMQKVQNTTTTRTDFLLLPPMDDLSRGVSLETSVFENNKVTEFYGKYTLNTQLNQLVNTVKFYYFKGAEIVKDEATFGSEGIGHEYHAVSRDGNMEYLRVDKQGRAEEVYYRCGESYIHYQYAKASATVKRLSKVDYTPVETTTAVYDIATASTYRSLNEIATFKDLEWLKTREKTYKVIQTIEEFDALMKELWKVNKPIAFDTETDGLVFNKFPAGYGDRNNLVGICIGWVRGTGYYIPVGHVSIWNVPLDYCIEQMKPLLETKHLVTHYGKFDINVMRTYGIEINVQDDTYLIQYILSNVDAQSNLSMSHMTKTHIGLDQIDLKDIFPGGKDGDGVKFQVLPLEHVKYYACADADFTLELYYLLRDKIPELSASLYKHEVYQMKVLSEMEYHGNLLDMENMEIEGDRCLRQISVLEQEIYNMAGYVFNINSPPALSNLLFNEMKCEVLVKTDTGGASTGATALKALSKQALDVPLTKFESIMCEDKELIKAKVLNTAKYPLIHVLLKYKKLTKLHSTFFAGMRRDANGGHLFSSYNQTRAITGRIISNFQQIPGSLKHLITEWEGHYLVNLDFQSIELRVMVGVSGETDVIEEFDHPEADPHRIIGSRLLMKPPQDISDDERDDCKVVNFGVPYDMGPYSLAQFLRGFPVTRENVDYARQMKEDYLNSMPKVKRMFTEVRNQAQTKGFVTTKFGRVGVFENLPKETDGGLISRGRRQAGNLRIQGTAADIMKITTNRLHYLAKQRNVPIHITGTIHDELVVMVRNDVHPYQIISLIKEAMEIDIKGFPKMYTGIAICSNWGQGKNDSIREIPVVLADRMKKDFEEGRLPEFDEHPKDFILDEIKDYLMGRFRDYFVELGFNFEDPYSSNFYEAVTDFKHIYLGPRATAYYADRGYPELIPSVKMALADCLGWELEEVESYFNRDLPDNVTNLNDMVFEIDTTDLEDDISEELFEMDMEQDIYFVEDETVKESENLSEGEIRETLRILTTFDTLVVNLEGCTSRTVTALTRYFKSLHQDDGLMGIVFNYYNDVIPVPYRIDNVERDYIMSLIEEAETDETA